MDADVERTGRLHSGSRKGGSQIGVNELRNLSLKM